MKHLKIISLLIIASFFWGCKEDAQEPGQAPEQAPEQERKIKVSVSYHPDGTEWSRTEYERDGDDYTIYNYSEGNLNYIYTYVWEGNVRTQTIMDGERYLLGSYKTAYQDNEHKKMIWSESYDKNGERTSLTLRTWYSDGYIDSTYRDSKLEEIAYFTNMDAYSTHEEIFYRIDGDKKNEIKYIRDYTYLDAEHTQTSTHLYKSVTTGYEFEVKNVYNWENKNNFTYSYYRNGVLTNEWRHEVIDESSKKQTVKNSRSENGEWVLYDYGYIEYY